MIDATELKGKMSAQSSLSHRHLKRVSVTTTVSVCKPTTRATWALLFWPTLPALTFVITERGLISQNASENSIVNPKIRDSSTLF